MTAQIYHWNANVQNSSATSFDCPDDNFQNWYDNLSTLSETTGSNLLKSATGNPGSIIIKNNCEWWAGVFSNVPIGGLPNFVFDYDISRQEFQNNNIILLGDLAWLGGRSIRYYDFTFENYSGNTVFFDFPVANQKKNYFYKFSFRGFAASSLNSQLYAGVKLYQENVDLNSTWQEFDDILPELRPLLQGSAPIFGMNYDYRSIPFFIEEDNNGSFPEQYQNHFVQVGVTTNEEKPSSLLLLDDIVVDCDQDNIVFDMEVAKTPYTDPINCDGQRYQVTLSSDCEYVNYSGYPYTVYVQGPDGLQLYTGTGIITYFDMTSRPTGQYEVTIEYDGSSGRNIKVNEYNLLPVRTFNYVPETDLIVENEVVTFDDPVYFPFNVIVKNGGVLNINNTASFKADKSLIVEGTGKLNVQGAGHLTACIQHWEGVLVKGSGEVNVLNGGSISKAVDAIKTETVPNQAKIICNAANFYDNTKNVSIYQNNNSESSFTSSVFTGGNHGVLLDKVYGAADDGILFEGNSFNYPAREGIIAYNSAVNVINGNQFIGCSDGIGLRNLYGGGQQAKIGSSNPGQLANTFTNNNSGVYSNAGDQVLFNNSYVGNSYGMYLSGINNFVSERNSYSGGYGEALYSTGNNSTYSNHNEYNTAGGIFAWQQNSSYTFSANCFSSQWFDVNAVGSINPTQGSPSIAASNCFTFGSTNDLLCNTSQTIAYFLPDPLQSSVPIPECFKPIAQSNYTVLAESSTSRTGGCGTSGFLPDSEYDYIKEIGCDSARLHIVMNSLQTRINTLVEKKKKFGINDSEERTLNYLRRHLRFARLQWVWCLRKRNAFRQEYEFHKTEATKEDALMAVESLVSLGQMADANAELDQIQSIYAVNPQIIAGLKLNILYSNYTGVANPLTVPHTNLLRTISALSDPYAAYSRALLYKYTGEKIEPVVTIQAQPRSVGKSENQLEIYSISPNPASDYLHISVDNENGSSVYEYKMTSLTGDVILKGNINGKVALEVSSLNSSIYIISITKDGYQVKNEKIVIIK